MNLINFAIAILLLLLPSTTFARDFKEVLSIYVKIDIKLRSTYYFAAGPQSSTLSSPQSISLERLNVGGERFWSIGGYPTTGCRIDDRFSLVGALFKVGGSHVEKVNCSSIANSETGTIVAKATAELSGKILSISSTISEDVVREGGVRTKAKTTTTVKVDLTKGCVVLAARVVHDSIAAAQGRKVNVTTASTKGFKKKCDIYPE